MGIVIEFRPRAHNGAGPGGARSPLARRAPGEAILDLAESGGDRHAVLEAASGILEVCRDRCGCTVMEDGLPRDPEALADALVALLRAMTMLEDDLVGRRPFPGFGIYFGRASLQWFEDGSGGDCALAVPNDVEPAALAHVIRQRIGQRRG